MCVCFYVCTCVCVNVCERMRNHSWPLELRKRSKGSGGDEYRSHLPRNSVFRSDITVLSELALLFPQPLKPSFVTKNKQERVGELWGDSVSKNQTANHESEAVHAPSPTVANRCIHFLGAGGVSALVTTVT